MRHLKKKQIITVLLLAAALLCCLGLVLHAFTAAPVPRILIAEDKVADRTVLPRELRNAGCEVTTVYDLKDVDPENYDALVVPGGGDVDPGFWGDEPHPAAGPFTPEVDYYQIRAIQLFAKAGKPILGICRGEQLINVAFGGTMIQNLYDKKTSPTYEEGFHRVTNKEGSWVHGIYGASPEVYFKHHQAVDRLGYGIVATSWSTDHKYRHIEAIEHETLPIYGVQWHPDAYVKQQGNAIYPAFRDVCLENMSR